MKRETSTDGSTLFKFSEDKPAAEPVAEETAAAPVVAEEPVTKEDPAETMPRRLPGPGFDFGFGWGKRGDILARRARRGVTERSGQHKHGRSTRMARGGETMSSWRAAHIASLTLLLFLSLTPELCSAQMTSPMAGQGAFPEEPKKIHVSALQERLLAVDDENYR